jgi:hypothetical protein
MLAALEILSQETFVHCLLPLLTFLTLHRRKKNLRD